MTSPAPPAPERASLVPSRWKLFALRRSAILYIVSFYAAATYVLVTEYRAGIPRLDTDDLVFVGIAFLGTVAIVWQENRLASENRVGGQLIFTAHDVWYLAVAVTVPSFVYVLPLVLVIHFSDLTRGARARLRPEDPRFFGVSSPPFKVMFNFSGEVVVLYGLTKIYGLATGVTTLSQLDQLHYVAIAAALAAAWIVVSTWVTTIAIFLATASREVVRGLYAAYFTSTTFVSFAMIVSSLALPVIWSSSKQIMALVIAPVFVITVFYFTKANVSESERTDELTGALARDFFLRTVGHHVLRVEGEPGGTAFVVVDVDDLRSVNRAHGYATGDAVLRALGDRVRALAGTGTVVGRIGPDEIAVAIPHGGIAAAESVAEKIRRAAPGLGVTSETTGETVQIGVRIGAAEALTGYETVTELLDAASPDRRRTESYRGPDRRADRARPVPAFPSADYRTVDS